jgi:phosphonate transport system substrate-binding protein
MPCHLRRLALVVALILPLVGSLVAAAEPFRFTAIPDQDVTRLTQRFTALAGHLEQQLGMPVEYVPMKTYAASVEAFKRGDVQLAWFGGLSGVQARLAVPGSRAIAQGVGDPSFLTYIIANAELGIEPAETLPDTLRGKTFTFGSKGSTSGRLMPEYFLRQHFGAAPEAIFQRVGYSGDHSRTLDLVEAGSYQLGAVNYQVYDSAVASGAIDPQQVRVIWKTPPYPDYNWTIRGDVAPELRAQVTQTLLSLADPELLQNLERSGFIPASNADYQMIEDVAVDVGIIRR